MKALLVIDMLKDFLDKDGALFCGQEARGIIPFVKQRIDEAHQEGVLVIFICDNHKQADLEFEMFPKHCVEGSEGSKVIDELQVGKSDIIIKKTRYSGFYRTNLEEVLVENEVDCVEVVGVCTSICIMDTVGDLRSRNYKVTVYKQGVSDFDSEAHNFALSRMEKIYGATVT